MMISILKTTIIAAGTMLLAFGSAVAAASKPIILIGPPHATKGYARHVLEGKEADIQEQAIPVANYGNYRAVVFLEKFPMETAGDEAVWNRGENREKVIEYLSNGGKVFILGPAFPRRTDADTKARDLASIEKVTGFGYYPNLTLINPVQVEPAGETLFGTPQSLDFVAPYTNTIDKVTTAKVLASVHEEKGKLKPFATLNPFGKGGVYWFGTTPFRLARELGNDHPNVKAYAEILRKALEE